ncbi:MAG: hypothetical protein RMJ15_05060 [Nitrososphaerota archaeon]|nr:hypothetical protein [Nitrososphaerota archaeon]
MGRKQIVWFCPICNYEAEAYPDSPPPICCLKTSVIFLKPSRILSWIRIEDRETFISLRDSLNIRVAELSVAERSVAERSLA